jgi:hypothetical protein
MHKNLRVRKPGWQIHDGTKRLFEEFEAEFFDDGIGEDILSDAFNLGLGFFAVHAIECEDEEFSLADVLNLGVTKRGKCALNGLSLWVKDGGFQHDPDVCLHRLNYTSPLDFAAARKSSR